VQDSGDQKIVAVPKKTGGAGKGPPVEINGPINGAQKDFRALVYPKAQPGRQPQHFYRYVPAHERLPKG
jgi:hypothetical protein